MDNYSNPRVESVMDTLHHLHNTCSDTQQKFLQAGALAGMEENMMVPDAKISAYIEVKNHLVLRVGKDMPEQEVLQSAFDFVEGQLARNLSGVWEGYQEEGYRECQSLLAESLSKD